MSQTVAPVILPHAICILSEIILGKCDINVKHGECKFSKDKDLDLITACLHPTPKQVPESQEIFAE